MRQIQVTANVTVVPSNVSIAVTPNPVNPGEPDAQGCRYRFAIELEERGGVATRFTALRVNGEDMMRQFGNWFGSTEIGANGRLRANVRVCAPGTPAPYQLLLAGTDPGSNTSWTRTALVEFNP